MPRKSYRRKGYYRADGTYVRPARIGPKLLPALRHGAMEQFGYRLNESASRRHTGLRRSARRVGYAKTMQRVNALRVLQKRQPDGKKALADVKWLKAHAAQLGSKSRRRRSRHSRL